MRYDASQKGTLLTKETSILFSIWTFPPSQTQYPKEAANVRHVKIKIVTQLKKSQLQWKKLAYDVTISKAPPMKQPTS